MKAFISVAICAAGVKFMPAKSKKSQNNAFTIRTVGNGHFSSFSMLEISYHVASLSQNSGFKIRDS